MPHIPEEQLKSEPMVEKDVIKTPEALSSPHDFLGKEYEFNGVSFTVLGMQPVFIDNDEVKEDLQSGVVSIINVQKQHIPVIPFHGGMAHITKIQIGDKVIVGSAEILKYIVIIEQAPEGWMTNNGIAVEFNVTNDACRIIADKYRTFHHEWFHWYIKNGRYFEHYAPELCQIIRNELSQHEYAPEGWMTNAVLVKLFENKGYENIQSIANTHRKQHPEWFRNYKPKRGKITEHYAPELCMLILNEISQQEQPPFDWMTKYGLAISLSRGAPIIHKIASFYRKSHPEWFRDYFTQGGFHEYFSPKLSNLIRKELSERKYAPKGWMTNVRLANELKKGQNTIKLIANPYRSSNPEWFNRYEHQTGSFTEYYSPELSDLIRKKSLEHEFAPRGWMTNGALAALLRKGQKTIEFQGNTHRYYHPEWFHLYKTKIGKVFEHYSPELCDLIRQAVKDTQS